MLRKVILLCAVICALPTLANAWYITATTSPATGQGTITPPGTTYIASTTSTQDFVVTPAAGYAISRVTLDGARIDPKAGTTNTFTVGYKAGATYRYIVAYFATVSGYTITVTLGANGSYQTSPPGQTLTSVPAGSSRTIVIIPYFGYQIDTLTAPGATITNTNNGTGSKNVAYTNIQANQAINATFKIVPNVVANAGPDLSTQGNSTEFAVTLNGSFSSSNMGPMTYSWTVTGPGIGVFSDPAAQSPSFYSTTPGVYTVSLTVTSGGIVSAPDTAVITVVSRTAHEEQNCSQCHASRNPAVITSYDASPHKAAVSMVVVCQTCHDPTNTGHYTVAQPIGVCATCHSTVTPQVVTDFQGSPHASHSLTCTTCHTDHSVTASGAICQTCHSTVTPQVVADYQGSLHAANSTQVVKCFDCHATHQAMTTFNVCKTCHSSFFSANGWHSTIQITLCQSCHNPHIPEKVSVGFPHFGSYTTAQYITTNISCPNCHVSSVDNTFNIYPANSQWARSGKANPRSRSWNAFDFKTRGTPAPATPARSAGDDCVRCHTTTGFINYATSNFTDIHAWGTSGLVPGGDRTKEMIACNACHDPTPFAADFSRRSVGIETDPYFNPGVLSVAAWYSYSSAATRRIIRAKTYANPAGPMFDSNICITCHAGKAAGDLIKLSTNCNSAPSVACRAGATGSFWANVDFIDPHNMGGANIMFPDGLHAGYEFRTGTATAPDHGNIGLDSSQGPCVGCHMSSPDKHRFAVLSTAGNGVISAITSPICTDCHGDSALSIDAGILEEKKEGYQAALAVITAQLAAKGIYYNAAQSPYFFNTADPAQQSTATRTVNWNYNTTFRGAHLMGAAFNLRLLHSDAGAWVHNGIYTRRLLYDTIDYLDDGNPTNNTVGVTVQNISLPPGVSKQKVTAYIGVRP
jgi:Cytochrome c3